MSMMKENLNDRLNEIAVELELSSEFVLDAFLKLDHFWEIFKFEEMKPEWITELSYASGYAEEDLIRCYDACMSDDVFPDERSRRMDFVIVTLEEDW